VESLGSKLRVLRKERGLSLQQLSIKAGCSASFISMVENDQVDPSISRLKGIAEGLGYTIIDLFQNSSNETVIFRKNKRKRIEFQTSKTAVEPLVPSGAEKKLDARLAVIYPGGSSEGYYRHAGEEFGLILKGQLELIIEGVQHLLEEGDSFYFQSTRNHRFKNPGAEETLVIWVNHPASF
jgi:transcriptional regulator with XRE-family HTH domain